MTKNRYLLQTRRSATAEIARDADDVDYKFSEVTVHLIKNATEYHLHLPIIRPNDIPTHA